MMREMLINVTLLLSTDRLTAMETALVTAPMYPWTNVDSGAGCSHRNTQLWIRGFLIFGFKSVLITDRLHLGGVPVTVVDAGVVTLIQPLRKNKRHQQEPSQNQRQQKKIRRFLKRDVSWWWITERINWPARRLLMVESGLGEEDQQPARK